LSAFVASTQENHDDLAAVKVVDAVAWSIIDPQFAHAFADGLHVTWIA